MLRLKHCGKPSVLSASLYDAPTLTKVDHLSRRPVLNPSIHRDITFYNIDWYDSTKESIKTEIRDRPSLARH